MVGLSPAGWYSKPKKRPGSPGFFAIKGWVAVQNDNHGAYDFRVHGDRRKAERRRDSERRGVLRWDPAGRERRSGRDRRQAGAYPRGGY